MSNSIWHDRYVELPEDVFVNSVRPCVIAVDENKKIIGANYGLKGSIPEIKYWARVDDLIAQADNAERLQKQLDSLKKYSDSLRNRINKMLKKNKTLKNTAADYFMKSVELGIELEKMKSNN